MSIHGSDDDQQVRGINTWLQPNNSNVQPSKIQTPNQQTSIAKTQNVV